MPKSDAGEAGTAGKLYAKHSPGDAGGAEKWSEGLESLWKSGAGSPADEHLGICVFN